MNLFVAVIYASPCYQAHKLSKFKFHEYISIVYLVTLFPFDFLFYITYMTHNHIIIYSQPLSVSLYTLSCPSNLRTNLSIFHTYAYIPQYYINLLHGCPCYILYLGDILQSSITNTNLNHTLVTFLQHLNLSCSL